MALRRGTRSRRRAGTADLSPVHERARELTAAGDVRAAIELLEASNRESPDSRTESLLIALRFDAVAEPEQPHPGAPWPPRGVPDLFPESVGGPPEVARSELSAEVVLSAIVHHGSLLVRGLVDRARVAQLVDDTERAFAVQDAWAPGADDLPASPWFSPREAFNAGRRFLREGGGVQVVESPRTFFHVTEMFEDIGIRELATGYFGEDPFLLANKWTLRRIEPDQPDADWHQDGAFMGDVRSLDVWVALSECGRDAPGLDLVGRRLDHVVATGTDDAQMDWTVGRGMVEQVAQGTVVRPEFEPGDALFIDHLCLHRTGTYPGMTRRRYALEAWFAAPSSYPARQLPVVY